MKVTDSSRKKNRKKGTNREKRGEKIGSALPL